jgi:hypothetical protein
VSKVKSPKKEVVIEKEWEKYDPKKKSRLLIASNDGVGCVLKAVGYGWEVMYNETGSLDLESNGLDSCPDAPDGISIWEGNIDEDDELVGEFRDLTEEEWKLYSQGKELWDVKDWIKASSKVSSKEEAYEALRKAEQNELKALADLDEALNTLKDLYLIVLYSMDIGQKYESTEKTINRAEKLVNHLL